MSSRRESGEDVGKSGTRCLKCKHLVEWPYCFAFLSGDGIPTEIRTGEVDHSRPYPGDHGLTYTPANSPYEITENGLKVIISQYAGQRIMPRLGDRKEITGPVDGPLARLREGEEIEIIPDLMTACAEGDMNAVREFIERGVDINATDADDNTPLMVACRHCHPEIVRMLLEKGADVNSKDKHAKTALSVAYEWGYPTIVELLKKYGAVG